MVLRRDMGISTVRVMMSLQTNAITGIPAGGEPAVRTHPRRGGFAEGETAVVDHVDGPDGRGELVFGKKEPARRREKVAARS
jgi:hypothetical protein